MSNAALVNGWYNPRPTQYVFILGNPKPDLLDKLVKTYYCEVFSAQEELTAKFLQHFGTLPEGEKQLNVWAEEAYYPTFRKGKGGFILTLINKASESLSEVVIMLAANRAEYDLMIRNLPWGAIYSSYNSAQLEVDCSKVAELSTFFPMLNSRILTPIPDVISGSILGGEYMLPYSCIERDRIFSPITGEFVMLPEGQSGTGIVETIISTCASRHQRYPWGFLKLIVGRDGAVKTPNHKNLPFDGKIVSNYSQSLEFLC
jgi:hypothetical protein